MALDPLYFAAIGAGLLAIVVVISFLVHRGIRRSSTPSRSLSTSRSPHPSPFTHGAKTTGSTGASGFLGYPPSPPQPNTASSHDSTSPPSTAGRLKKSNSAPRRPGDLKPLSPIGGGSPDSDLGEDSEMVMVTYEEGLKKLGLGRTQHILYPDPPTFDSDGETATPPFSTQSSRPTPTTAALLTPGKMGGGAGAGAQRNMFGRQHDSPLKNIYSTSPKTPTTRMNAGRAEETGRFPTDSELMSTGIPSYYHETSYSRYKLEERE